MAYTDYATDEIESAIDGGCEYEPGEEGWHGFGYAHTGDVKEITLRDEKVSAVYLDGESGGEGSGESVWIVFRVGSQYFKKTGYYASHDGTHWDGDVTEVRPKQRTVTFYE